MIRHYTNRLAKLKTLDKSKSKSVHYVGYKYLMAEIFGVPITIIHDSIPLKTKEVTGVSAPKSKEGEEK